MRKISITLGFALLLTLCSFAVDWINFENKEGGFKAMFPRQPTKSEQEINSEKGSATLIQYLYDGSKYKDESGIYGVGYLDQIDSAKNSDMPDEDIDNLLHSALEGGAKNMNGEIVSEKEISLKGYRGREGKMHMGEENYMMLMRVYLVQKRMYVVQVAYEMGKENITSNEKFLNSFDISAQQRVVKEKPVNNNWAKFERGNFKVLFPEQPEENERDVESKAGMLKMHALSYQTGKYKDDNEAYILIYTDYPEDAISSDFKDALVDTFFNNSIRGMLKKKNFTKRSESKISYKGYPGRSLKIDMEEQNAVMNLRIYLVHSRAFILQTICYRPKDNNALSDKFFNSFDVTAGK